jgi:hypothetical protein
LPSQRGHPRPSGRRQPPMARRKPHCRVFYRTRVLIVSWKWRDLPGGGTRSDARTGTSGGLAGCSCRGRAATVPRPVRHTQIGRPGATWRWRARCPGADRCGTRRGTTQDLLAHDATEGLSPRGGGLPALGRDKQSQVLRGGCIQAPVVPAGILAGSPVGGARRGLPLAPPRVPRPPEMPARMPGLNMAAGVKGPIRPAEPSGKQLPVSFRIDWRQRGDWGQRHGSPSPGASPALYDASWRVVERSGYSCRSGGVHDAAHG